MQKEHGDKLDFKFDERKPDFLQVAIGIRKVNFDRLRRASHAVNVELATEDEFSELFPMCEVGAMPPFGNLYDMEVYVDEPLSQDDEIAFNAGTHTELIKMRYADYEQIVHPMVCEISG